jgi:hypothetical protein
MTNLKLFLGLFTIYYQAARVDEQKAYLDIIKETGNLFTVYAKGLINTLRGVYCSNCRCYYPTEENKVQMSL